MPRTTLITVAILLCGHHAFGQYRSSVTINQGGAFTTVTSQFGYTPVNTAPYAACPGPFCPQASFASFMPQQNSIFLVNPSYTPLPQWSYPQYPPPGWGGYGYGTPYNPSNRKQWRGSGGRFQVGLVNIGGGLF